MPRTKASPTTKDRLAANVKRRRTDAGLTQLEVAIEAGVNPGTIYWIERNGRATLATIDAVAKVLGCSPADLLA